MAAPQMEESNSKLAYRGRAVSFDEIESRSALPNPSTVTVVSQHQDYEPPTDIDYTDLASINIELSRLRVRLHQVRKELKTAKRNAMRDRYSYEHEKRVKLIGLSGGSDKSRDAIAELLTEDLYARYLVSNAVADELNQHSRDIRTDLDALKEISNNLRGQIKIT